jgi:MFS family permease
MFIGFMAAGLLHRWLKVERLPGVGLGVIGLGVGVMAVAPSLWVAMAGMVLVGLGNVLFNVGLGPLMQIYVEVRFLGRVMGVFRSLSTASLLVGASLAGYLTHLVGPRWVIGAASLLLWVAALEGGRRLARSVGSMKAEAEAAAEVVPSASAE